MPEPILPDDQRKLIELAYLGEWMINAHHDPEHQDETAQSVVQKLLAKNAKLDSVGRDVETGDYYLDEAWTDRLYNDYIGEYDDHIFWDELTERLAQRDLAKSRNLPTDDINRDDDLIFLKPIEESYRRELERHGIDHLELSEDSH